MAMFHRQKSMIPSETRLIAHKAVLKAKEGLLWKQRLESRLAETERSLAEQRDRVKELERAWSRESADVKRLTGLSVVGLVTSVLGTKAQKLQKERQELAAASLKLEAGREVADGLEMERDKLADELTGMEDADVAYQAALIDKERLIRDEGETGRQLAALAEEEAKNREQARETREALAAGRNVEFRLDRVVENLNSASNWGAWDMMGGGWIATGIKHSRLDDAKAEAIGAQTELQRFRRELADVGHNLVASIEIGDFSRFADYFFDGLIMDWCVQNKISAALSQTKFVQDQVKDLVYRLRREEEQCRLKDSELQGKRETLIERA